MYVCVKRLFQNFSEARFWCFGIAGALVLLLCYVLGLGLVLPLCQVLGFGQCWCGAPSLLGFGELSGFYH